MADSGKSETIQAIEQAAKLAADAIAKAGEVAVAAVTQASRVANDTLKDNNNDISLIKRDIEYIQKDVKEIKEKLESRYVTKEEFDPIKRIVYGMVGVILLAVVGALVALVLK